MNRRALLALGAAARGAGLLAPALPAFPATLLTAFPVAMLTASPAAAQPDYPSRPVAIAIGYAAGGLTDVMTRLIAELLARELGQPVVVENRTGAATALASTAVANARPDGYSLLIGTNSLAINLALPPGATPRDPLRELTPVGEVYHTPFLMLVHREVGAPDLPALLERARREPGALNYGSSGSGSVNHLLTELLLQKAGVRMTHIPYRGAAPALVDLRAGRLQAFYATPLDAQPLLAEGLARAVAISSAERLASMPAVPSVAETHLGCEGVLWQGLFAPARTPEAVVARLHAALRRVLDDPALSARVADQGVVLLPGDAAALRARLAADIPLWERVVREGGIEPG